MKKRYFCLVLSFCFLFSSVLNAQNNTANRKTAERCLKLAESCVINNNWNTALSQAELGLSYDETISDLYYIKANAISHIYEKPSKGEILQIIKKSFEYNNWVNYNKNGARILYADLLSDTRQFEESLKILNEEPYIYSADGEFIRIKNNYRIGTSNSIDQARTKLSSARKIYPNDQRFPSLFFTFETLFMNNAERNGITYKIPDLVQKMAENYIVKFPDYSTKDVEMETMASMFSNGERQKRLLKAIGEKNRNNPLFAVAALKAGVITEEKAFNLFFDNSNDVYPLILLEDFASLITDSNLKQNLYDRLNSFDGTLVLDEDLDISNELIVKYYRGRPQTIYYDENNDGILEMLCDCDFGVPVKIVYGNTKSELTYDIYPAVLNVNIVSEQSYYTFLDDDLAYTPFEMLVNPPFKKLGVDFYIPYISKEIVEPDKNLLVQKANSIEIPVEDRPGAKAKYTVYKGIPVLINFYEGNREYAFANLEAGYPFTRYVDYDNDNQFETSEIYDYDEKGEFQSEEDKNLIVKCFGNISLTENLYLKKVEIDKDNDTIIDFYEEYLGNGGKISAWDVDGNGLWDNVYIRYPLTEDNILREENSIFNSTGTSSVIVKNENGIPVKLNYKNKDLDLLKGNQKNYYWIETKGDLESEAAIYGTIGDTFENAVVRVVTYKEKRFSVIRVGDFTFIKQLPPTSYNYDFKEFVNE
ncbi:MAG: hypothetical protein MJ174_01195 [Treponema sp.]|nr:hypothetical protein [Treponema sp.]